MIFSDKIDKKEYEDFVVHNKYKSHFMQSTGWGEFQEAVNKRKAYYTGVYKDEKLVAACMLLEKKLPLGYSYMYAPRGPVLNFEDTETLDFLINNLKAFAKKKKAIYIKFDPDIIIKREDYKEEPVKIDMDTDKLFKHLTEGLKLKHLGFTKNFETAQPRFTYRIDLSPSGDEIYSRFSKTAQKTAKKAEESGCIYVKTDASHIEEFYSVMLDTENRKDFVGHNKEYYKNLFNYFKDLKLYLAYIKPTYLINLYQDKIDNIENKLNKLDPNLSKNQGKINEYLKQISFHKKNLDIYEDALNTYGEKILLNAYIIMHYGNKAWALYGGSKTYLQNTSSNIGLYKYMIMDAKASGLEIYDNFGAVAKDSNNDYLLGLNNFKKSFGGDFIELMGEFDLIINKPLYFLFNKLVPIYRKIINKKIKKQNKKRSD